MGIPHADFGEVPLVVLRDPPQAQNHARINEVIVETLGPNYAVEDIISLSELGMTEFLSNSTWKIMKITLKEAILQSRKA